jgi:hypothetical protein
MWKHPREGESVGCQNRFGNIGCCSTAITGTSGSLLHSTTVTLTVQQAAHAETKMGMGRMRSRSRSAQLAATRCTFAIGLGILNEEPDP